MQVCGLTIAILGLRALGRSVGVVAANRGVKLNGMYRQIRHPMYSGYMLSYIGYVAAYPSLRNGIIIAITFVALLLRAAAEERFLRQDPAYEDYLARTRWRFVPFIY
jgi:protein-S-isoprenylcysteine O-methyltransferase Ste14